MGFYADLHIHSKYSRATARDCDLEHLGLWACRKGISVIGTGDFTHPAWLAEIDQKLVPAEPGLLRLAPAIERDVARQLPPALAASTRFMLQVEISTIYKRGDRTRKVHHVIYVPDREAAHTLSARLARIGNIASDGRPILGLDSRDLLEIVLESSSDAFLVPAHIWTPWFAVLGSKSGFDSIEECYADLAGHIFALETGLSSDPEMNWRLSALDRYRLVSNSDAHSPAKLGREACVFDTALSYFDMRRALETGEGYGGTVELFPEEGKYHLDGHRKCGVCLSPEQTRRHAGSCPGCGKPVTVGVMHRVQALADRPEGGRPAGAAGFRSLVPLVEILAEVLRVGAGSKTVAAAYGGMLARLGPELLILEQLPLEELGRTAPPLVAEAVARLRQGRVTRQAGYDGEYGVIRLFDDAELARASTVGVLFPDVERAAATPAAPIAPSSDNAESGLPPAGHAGRPVAAGQPRAATPAATSSSPVALPGTTQPTAARDGLDPQQRAAATAALGPLLVIAGPGTGKTRTLTHRIAHLVQEQGLAPSRCLAVTFTRRAAEEMRERLRQLLGDAAGELTVTTFHGLGLSILREHAARLGLPERFRILDEEARAGLLTGRLGIPASKARRLLAQISLVKRTRAIADAELAPVLDAYTRALRGQGAVDFEDLLLLPVQLFETTADAATAARGRFDFVAVDELQDIDPLQYELLQRLVPPDHNVCAIGDPDQSIYSFRGADARLFRRFEQDLPGARVIELSRNYRSSPAIVQAAVQVIGPSSLAEGRTLEALSLAEHKITIHEAATDRAEAEYVAHTIEQLVGGHSFFSFDSDRAEGGAAADLTFGDFAVLYRTDAQAELLCEALGRSGMPFGRHGHTPLGDQPEVRSLLDHLAATQPGAPLVERLAEAAKRAGESRGASAACAYLAPLARSAGSDIDHLLDELALATGADLLDPRAERISLLTLHASKGLEFPVVFIVGCEEGILPLAWGSRPDNLEEERRLFFVGLTRARERLFLCHARERVWRGRKRELGISSFARAIEAELLQRAHSRGRAKARKAQLDLF